MTEYEQIEGIFKKLADVAEELNKTEFMIKNVQGNFALAGHIQREVVDEFYE